MDSQHQSGASQQDSAARGALKEDDNDRVWKRLTWMPSGLRSALGTLAKRTDWTFHNTSPRKLLNMFLAGIAWIFKFQRVPAMPIALKIDLSPVCNLRCTICVHSHPGDNPTLLKQHFDGHQRMTVEQFTAIINEVKGRTSTASLYYVGEPMMHPEMEKMCRIAADAGIATHISSNFSFPLSDERIQRLLDCGLSHLTICLDGMTQDVYSRTRVGGNIELVKSNMVRFLQARDKAKSHLPHVEVQYIKFPHNVHETETAREFCQSIGVNSFSTFWGNLSNYVVTENSLKVVAPKPRKFLPLCTWTHFAMTIKYNGDVIPCCNHRYGDQYTKGEPVGVLGNVFQSGVRAVWNGPAYRKLRRLANHTKSFVSKESPRGIFCDRCPTIFQTNIADLRLSGPTYTFEDIYTINEKGIPVRRDDIPVKK